ncbi:hypothetical protein [Cardinium endosymbiont of Bemisia tabaci]|uniref:hypothetical protein n=1 Tax=Cardinium endosymbiont of Bemisia tabaci TaxID=672794 RepID=UPI000442D107|nr:hypothetical protein [Cardinium endosymbiont of Bemisia tabaci]CDG49861.1 Hypothetical protein CHV_b0008 [Cardinium endosymbiont cBtQ1 of Bemisia tabaci]
MKIKKGFALHLLMLAGCNGMHHTHKISPNFTENHSQKGKEPTSTNAAYTPHQASASVPTSNAVAPGFIATTYAICAAGFAGGAYIMGDGEFTSTAAAAALTMASGAFAAGSAGAFGAAGHTSSSGAQADSIGANAIGAVASIAGAGALAVQAAAADDDATAFCDSMLAFGAGSLAICSGALAIQSVDTARSSAASDTDGVDPKAILNDVKIIP